jgi:DNA mismatch repair protein MutS2
MKIEELQQIKDGLWGEIRNIEAAIDDIIVAGTAQSSLSLEGSEVLSFYGDIHGLERRVKSAVADTIEEALTAGRSRLCEFFKGSEIIIPRELFESEYPCQINRNIIEQIEEKIDGMISSENSQAEIEQSRTIQKIISTAQKSISQCIEIDMWIGIGQWAQQYKCTLPKLDSRRPGICMRDGRHILLDVKPDPVTYGIGGPANSKNNQNLALLTGANSGGKTTLIETIAIITLLAHSGLAVPALSAKVGLLDEIHLLAKVTGTQSAGALERTLIRLAEVFISEKRKLVLADELEAITEPEAAARILGGLLAASNNNSETAVLLVTHIGRSIEAAIGIDVRIDGIEARGLDENLELIVDRTPRRNYIAKSTPELIVRRLAARASGNTANLFENLLKSFS